ncbi:MAG TPA: hypothetical protein PKK43_15400, partial [Spirochaetota bacterium]|nr:hypothetical protein [Spirochaetota bacterium]
MNEDQPIRTANYVNAGKFINEMLSAQGMGAVIGEKGAGKTYIMRKIIGSLAEKKDSFRVVEINPIGEQVRNITQIMHAMIKDISGGE